MMSTQHEANNGYSTNHQSGSHGNSTPHGHHTDSEQELKEQLNSSEVTFDNIANEKSKWKSNCRMFDIELTKITGELLIERHDRMCDVLQRMESHLADIRQHRDIMIDCLQHSKESVESLKREILLKNNDIATLVGDIQGLQTQLSIARSTRKDYGSKLSNILSDIESLEGKSNIGEVKDALRSLKEKYVHHDA